MRDSYELRAASLEQPVRSKLEARGSKLRRGFNRLQLSAKGDENEM